MGRLDRRRVKSWPFAQDDCLTCGLCSSLCPASGIDGYDPRKLIRMVELGQIEELLEARWLWLCTMCSKCVNFCPMEINISEIVRSIRTLWDREKVPGDLHTGLVRALETGNINALSKEEYVYRTIFDSLFASDSLVETVPVGPSIACSTPTAIAWSKQFKMHDPSGRAILKIHQEAYEEN